MTPGYHDNARLDVLPWLPLQVSRCFDLGCGAGGTLGLLKTKYPGAWLAGLEMDEKSASNARKLVDEVWCGDADKFDFSAHIESSSLDLILCLDVLEHLVDPWSVVKKLSPLLNKGGRLITSLPNIRYHKLIKTLLIDGNFNYTDEGLMDRTHLRFFVRKTAEELVTCGGLKLKSVAPAKPIKNNGIKGIANRLLGGRFNDLLTLQYMLVAESV
jgi:2-polyprenyl-3-methyl-5-hydroxy-6-metoxy-1,4-benzoquinol methylase